MRLLTLFDRMTLPLPLSSVLPDIRKSATLKTDCRFNVPLFVMLPPAIVSERPSLVVSASPVSIVRLLIVGLMFSETVTFGVSLSMRTLYWSVALLLGTMPMSQLAAVFQLPLPFNCQVASMTAAELNRAHHTIAATIPKLTRFAFLEMVVRRFMTTFALRFGYAVGSPQFASRGPALVVESMWAPNASAASGGGIAASGALTIYDRA